MKKKWIATSEDYEKTIRRLYVTTTDKKVAADLQILDSHESASLISYGRLLNARDTFSDHTNHHDLATGAIYAYARNRNLKITKLELTDLIPKGLRETPMGGEDNQCIISVFEE